MRRDDLYLHLFQISRSAPAIYSSKPRREVRLDLVQLNHQVHLCRQLIEHDLPLWYQWWRAPLLHELLYHFGDPAELLDRNAIVADDGVLSCHLQLLLKVVLHLFGCEIASTVVLTGLLGCPGTSPL